MTTPVERRFATAYRQADSDEPGLIQEDDGTIWQVRPDGTRVQIGTASGGSLLGPFRINYNDADLDNPETGNGLQTIAIPADSLVRVVVVFREPWVGAQSGDQLAIGVAPTQSGSGLYLCGYDLGDSPANAPEIGFLEGNTLLAGGAANAIDLPKSAFVVVDCHVFVAMYAAGPITAGSADVYALVANDGTANGGSQPPELLEGTDPATTPLEVDAPAGQLAHIFRAWLDKSGNGPFGLTVEKAGNVSVVGGLSSETGNPVLAVSPDFRETSLGKPVLSVQNRNSADRFQVFEGGEVIVVGGSNDAGPIGLTLAGPQEEPSDDGISPHEVTFWIDPSPGSASFNIKGKDSNGTVVRASIPLT